MPKRRAVFLDRDGVMNRKAEENDYVKSWEEFELLPGVPEALRLLQAQGLRLIVTTNQRGVARGLMEEATVEEIHARMRNLFASHGVHFDAIYYCPHEKGSCDCRKPLPGMLLRGLREFPDIDLESSMAIGDSLSDVEAGNRAGCPGLLIADDTRAPKLMAEARSKGLQIAGVASSLLEVVTRYMAPPAQRRVLFVHTIVGRGGDAVQVQAMIEALRRLGHAVQRSGVGGLHPYAFQSAVSSSRSLAKRLPWWAKDLAELALNTLVGLRAYWNGRRFRPDLVMERMTPYGLGGLLAATLLRVPLVVHLDAPFEAERSFRQQPMFRHLHRFAMRCVGRRARVVIVGSEAARQHYTAMGIPGERILLLRNGVFADEVSAGAVSPAEAPVVGFVGSMARWHRVGLLIEAFAKLRERGTDANLWLIGMGEDYASLVEQVQQRGLREAVRFFGPMERTQLLPLIRQFHVAVLPHTLDTGSPMKLFEYAASGVPTAAPDLPNIREIWGDSAFTLFHPQDATALADALDWLLRNRSSAMDMAATAQELVRDQYTWEQQMGQIISTTFADRSQRS